MSKIMVAGTVGGREHALGEALYNGGENEIIFTHGGNAGTQGWAENLDDKDNEAIANRAVERGVDLVVVGPEAPLAAGLADMTRERGIATFGPGRNGAQLEASKAFKAEFDQEAGILQPEFAVTNSLLYALPLIEKRGAEADVEKAFGLAGGKGALLPESEEEAISTAEGMLNGKMFGDAGRIMVFQRRLDASRPELSGLYVIDGKHFTLLPLSQDHKRRDEGDKGPNTGGVGAYSPLPFVNDRLENQLMDNGERIVGTLAKRGIDYRGVVYAGLMTDAENDDMASTLEYGIRFGDPEIEVVLARLAMQGINVAELLTSVANGSLDESLRSFYLGKNIGQAAITVCLATEGYPDSELVKQNKDKAVEGLDRKYEGVTIHHAGTSLDKKGRVVTSGGRVLYVTAVGENIDEAALRAYSAIGKGAVWFEGAQYRRDIAHWARSEYQAT